MDLKQEIQSIKDDVKEVCKSQESGMVGPLTISAVIDETVKMTLRAAYEATDGAIKNGVRKNLLMAEISVDIDGAFDALSDSLKKE